MKEEHFFANESQISDKDIKQYQVIIDSIMFSMIETRSNIAFVTFIISRHAKNSEKTHIEIVKIILRYLDVIKNRDIIFDEDDLTIQSYFDFDWTEDKKKRKSISDYIFMLNNDSISWCFKR